MRDAATGGKLIYEWDIDKGTLTYVPQDDAPVPTTRNDESQSRPVHRPSIDTQMGGDVDF